MCVCMYCTVLRLQRGKFYDVEVEGSLVGVRANAYRGEGLLLSTLPLGGGLGFERSFGEWRGEAHEVYMR